MIPSIYETSKTVGGQALASNFASRRKKPNILAESLSLGGYKSNRPSFYGMQFVSVEGNGSLFALRRKYEWILTGIFHETGKGGEYWEARDWRSGNFGVQLKLHEGLVVN